MTGLVRVPAGVSCTPPITLVEVAYRSIGDISVTKDKKYLSITIIMIQIFRWEDIQWLIDMFVCMVHGHIQISIYTTNV